MAISTLQTLTTPSLHHTFQLSATRPHHHCTTIKSHSNSNRSLDSTTNLTPKPNKKSGLVGVEPSCELQFAPSGLGYCDVAPGFGEEAPYSTLINIHYTARFADGVVFDSSYKRGRPLTMRIGVGKVIKGLDQGIFGGEGVPPMLVGGRRRLQIPPELAYGPEPAGCFSGECNIPANATLLYDINFVNIYSGNRALPPK
ncbi:unnamed protein product [Lactuca saligna]|uniref:peptidylprolyl isomerase n=1 Tax=Lactuca saligna TaxID=75948 RepID=A0AA35Z2X2_LACSI|nr:unnamed protein product [Lactuca saligna]